MDRLIDWLIDWWIDWLTDGSIDWLMDRLIDWWIDGSIDWSIDWLIDFGDWIFCIFVLVCLGKEEAKTTGRKNATKGSGNRGKAVRHQEERTPNDAGETGDGLDERSEIGEEFCRHHGVYSLIRTLFRTRALNFSEKKLKDFFNRMKLCIFLGRWYELWESDVVQGNRPAGQPDQLYVLHE